MKKISQKQKEKNLQEISNKLNKILAGITIQFGKNGEPVVYKSKQK